jgi:hypothetical protein
VQRNVILIFVDSDPTEPVCLAAAHQSPQVLADQQVELAAAQKFFDFRKLGPVKPLALAFCGDDGVFDRSLVHVDDNLFRVIRLVVEAYLLLVGASADARNDAYLQRVAVPWRDRGLSVHFGPPKNLEGRGEKSLTQCANQHDYS